MIKTETKLDKTSLLFAFVSIITYWLLAFNGFYGIIISICNSFFWLFYFYKKNILSQFLIHISYQIANVIYILHFLNIKLFFL